MGDEPRAEPTPDRPSPELTFSLPASPPSNVPPNASSSTPPAPGVAPPPYSSYQAPLPYAQYRPAAGSPGAGQAAPRNPQATASLVLGIVSMVASIVFLPAIVGVVLGIVGVLRSGRTDPPVGRTKAIVGILLSVLSVPLGVVLVDQIATSVRSGLAGLEQALEESAPATGEDGGAESAAPVPDLADFVQVDAAEWEAIAKDPDRAQDRPIVVFAEVAQFDNTTGPDRFRALAGVDQPGISGELETNSVFIGDETLLDDVEDGDVLKIHAVVTGSFEYENTIGGTATVPALTIAGLEDVGLVDVSKDVKLGAAVTNEIGLVSVPATVTNSGGKTFTYFIDVVAESKDGSTSYATGTGYVESLKAGRDVEAAVDFFEDIPADAVFRIEKVERYPAAE